MSKMSRNFLPCFSLEPHHIYKFNGAVWRFAYRNMDSVTFHLMGDPRTQITLEISALTRMNAAGEVSVIPFGLLPEHARPASLGPDDDVFIASLTADQKAVLDGRYAMVRAVKEFAAQNADDVDTEGRIGKGADLSGGNRLRMTDASITQNMDRIRKKAEEYLREELPDPASALAEKEWRDGVGPKPKTPLRVLAPAEISARTLRRWVAAYDHPVYGGKSALIGSSANQGNHTSYFSFAELNLMAKVINDEYLTLQRKSIRQVVDVLQNAIRAHNAAAAKKAATPGEATEGPSADKEADVQNTLPAPAPLRMIGREAVRRHIAKLDKFHVLVMRKGFTYAMKKMRAVGSGLTLLRPLERVEMDEWKIDLLTLIAETGLLNYLPKELLEELKKKKSQRWWVCMAICCRTRCILGLCITPDPKASSAVNCLHLMTVDKTELANSVGAVTPWSMFGTPELLATDNGSAFKSIEFSSAAADLGITKLQTIAKVPGMRGIIERFFYTVILKLLPELHGRVFSNPEERGDHPSEARACLTIEDFVRILIRWIVDVYHNSPHDSLNGITPLEQWERDMAAGNYPLKSAPHLNQKQVAFGMPITRVLTNAGVRVLNIQYRSDELQAKFRDRGNMPVEVRWLESDIGQVQVLFDQKWHRAEAVVSGLSGEVLPEFSDVNASTWLQVQHALRSRDPGRVAWERSVISNALRDIRGINDKRATARGIIDPHWSPARLAEAERQADGTLMVVPDVPHLEPAADGHGHVVNPVGPYTPDTAKTEVEDVRTDHPKTAPNRSWDME